MISPKIRTKRALRVVASFLIGKKGKDMVLSDFLRALDGTQTLITISDSEEKTIIKFYSGTTALDDVLEARTIKRFKVVGNDIKIILNDAE